jgi:hypothetical protein
MELIYGPLKTPRIEIVPDPWYPGQFDCDKVKNGSKGGYILDKTDAEIWIKSFIVCECADSSEGTFRF